jgi:hypothetical protein
VRRSKLPWAVGVDFAGVWIDLNAEEILRQIIQGDRLIGVRANRNGVVRIRIGTTIWISFVTVIDENACTQGGVRVTHLDDLAAKAREQEKRSNENKQYAVGHRISVKKPEISLRSRVAKERVSIK